MGNNVITWLGAIFITISLIYTGCSFFEKDADEENTAGYVAAKAVVDMVLPARVSRYGAKPPRYNITIISASGEKFMRFDLSLAGEPKVKDTITVYYDPKNPQTSKVKSKL